MSQLQLTTKNIIDVVVLVPIDVIVERRKCVCDRVVESRCEFFGNNREHSGSFLRNFLEYICK